MSINNRRRLRARLQRVADALAKKGPAPDPGPITLAVARELAEECGRLRDLVDQEGGNNRNCPAFIAFRSRQTKQLHDSIAEKRKLI